MSNFTDTGQSHLVEQRSSVLPWQKASNREILDGMIDFEWPCPTPEYLALIELRAIIGGGLLPKWSRARLAKRWRQSERWVRRLMVVAMSDPVLSGNQKNQKRANDPGEALNGAENKTEVIQDRSSDDPGLIQDRSASDPSRARLKNAEEREKKEEKQDPAKQPDPVKPVSNGDGGEKPKRSPRFPPSVDMFARYVRERNPLLNPYGQIQKAINKYGLDIVDFACQQANLRHEDIEALMPYLMGILKSSVEGAPGGAGAYIATRRVEDFPAHTCTNGDKGYAGAGCRGCRRADNRITNMCNEAKIWPDVEAW